MKKAFLTILMVLAWVTSALADGDSRPATDDEKRFCLRVLSAFEASVPQSPPGWQITEKKALEAPDVVVLGQETFPMTVDYSIKWQDGEKMAAARAEMEQQMAAMAEQLKPDEKMRAGIDEMERLAQELGKAMEANDMKKVETLQKAMEEIGNRINETASVKEQDVTRQIRALTPHDVELSVHLSANVFSQPFTRIPSEQDTVAGGKIVHLGDEGYTGETWHEESSYLFFGDFTYVQEESSAYMQAQPVAGAPHTRVQTVVIRFTGEKERVRKVIQQMDLKAIRALLGT